MQANVFLWNADWRHDDEKILKDLRQIKRQSLLHPELQIFRVDDCGVAEWPVVFIAPPNFPHTDQIAHAVHMTWGSEDYQRNATQSPYRLAWNDTELQLPDQY